MTVAIIIIPFILFCLQILTKDSVTVRVDAVVFYRIYNPTMSIINVENANSATYFVAQTTLRNVLGTKKLSELLTDRDSIGDEMQVTRRDGVMGGLLNYSHLYLVPIIEGVHVHVMFIIIFLAIFMTASFCLLPL